MANFSNIEAVKDKLPNVKVLHKGKLYTGRVSGRKNKFATVDFAGTSAEWSWEAVTRAYNNKSALKA